MQYRSLVDLLQRRARETPEASAYTFLADGDGEALSISYAGLDARARAIAAHLQALGMQGERALLLYPQSLEYLAAFWGCLYAGVIAVPLYPPTVKQRSMSRIDAIAGDAGCRLALGAQRILSARRTLFDGLAAGHDLTVVATDAIAEERASAWRHPAIGPGTVAYLQYTSGSTAVPKGVMVSHGNLLHNLAYMREAYPLDPQSAFVNWAPFFHDMGLIMGTLLPLWAGMCCVLMSPAAFAQRPLRWLMAISNFRASASFGSNFAFDLCAAAAATAAERRIALDLSCLRIVINGSEPVRAETLDRFAEALRPHGFREDAFYPSYGLAEATLVVSCGRMPAPAAVKSFSASRTALEAGRIVEAPGGSEDGRTLVSCGAPCPSERILIVDPEALTPCEAGRVGEIWVAGDSVALGYWYRPKETAETFGARLARSGEGPFLRTGDLGFLRDGELFITGRLKDLIIIRGRNLYPQDIEHSVERCHPAIRPGCGAAFPVDLQGEEKLVVVQELEHGQERAAASIAAVARRAIVEEHEVQPHAVVLIKPGSIPKTSSGKIQRRACRDAFLKGALQVYGG